MRGGSGAREYEACYDPSTHPRLGEIQRGRWRVFLDEFLVFPLEEKKKIFFDSFSYPLAQRLFGMPMSNS